MKSVSFRRRPIVNPEDEQPPRPDDCSFVATKKSSKLALFTLAPSGVKFTGAVVGSVLVLLILMLFLETQSPKTSVMQTHAPTINNTSSTLHIQDVKYAVPPAERMAQHNGADVIVYLAQFGHHSSYGKQTDGVHQITGSSKLEKSLMTLYANYVDDFPCDVIVFYGEDNEADPELFEKLQKDRPRLQFRQLTGKFWELPHGLKAENRNKWFLPSFSIGYRHMIRWYA